MRLADTYRGLPLSSCHNLTQTPATSTDPKTAQYGLGSQSSWDYEKSLLLILESDLSSRFAYIEQVLCRDKYVLPLRNVTKRHVLGTLMARFSERHEVTLAYEELKTKLSRYRFIFLSHTEGFIAKNIAKWIRRDCPNIILVALQHGIFMLENNRRKRALVFCSNKLTEFATDYSVAGDGVVQEAVDFYIVYNNWYKSLLVSQGVPGDRIIVSSVLLKGKKLFDSRKPPSTDNHTALFLLQCLSALSITDRESEIRVIDCVVKWLSEHYDFVLLKQHPYCNIEIAELPGNCRFVEGDIMDIAENCGTVVSFFSSALFECEVLGLRTIAISDDSMTVIPGIYELFKEVGEVQKDGSLLLKTNSNVFSAYFESEIGTPEELLAFLGGRKGSSGDILGERPALGLGASK